MILLMLLLTIAAPCDSASEDCKKAAREAIITWRTTADLRLDELTECREKLKTRTSSAIEVKERSETSNGPAYFAAGAGVTAVVVLVLKILFR
jgi:hypothetical protein